MIQLLLHSSLRTRKTRPSAAGRCITQFSWILVLAFFAIATMAVPAQGGTIDFEGFSDSTILTTQYTGLTFSNAIILTSGISLNEFEFPPHSGTNVTSDNNGPMTVAFSTPIKSFSGYFTHAVPLTLTAFDSLNNQVASTISLFSNNEALSGDPGSNPNELIQVAFASGFSSVTILGDPAGGSFVVDDATYLGAAVPEPATTFLIFPGVAIVAMASQKRRTKQSV